MQQPRQNPKEHKHRIARALGLGLITGAADDDPSAIGTYASAGAKFGLSILWTAPVTFPMMVAVVYLSAKLGQVTGMGLFAAMRSRYRRFILYPALAGVIFGNVVEAGADLGGITAALKLLCPRVPANIILIGITAIILLLQIFGTYAQIRNVFRWLALSLLAYVGSAILATPDWGAVIKGTLLPTIHFNKDFLTLLVAIIGTTLSAYLYTWQSNEEVEEKIQLGRRRLTERRGTTDAALRATAWDVVFGMFFSNAIMYFIILSTSATLFKANIHEVDSAAQAAQALRPLAGALAQWLFALGIIGVGFLAVPVMTTGAAYDLTQTLGYPHGLNKKPREAKAFYVWIAIFTLVAMAINFLGVNPIKALVWAGVVQGFSTPPLMLIIMLLTNDPTVMGEQTNRPLVNVLGWITTVVTFAATLGLVLSWIL